MRVLAVLLGFAVWLASTAAPVAAADVHRGQVRGGQVRGDFRGSRHFGGHHHHGFSSGPFFPLFVAPSVVVVSPVVVAPTPVYSAPPVFPGPAVYAYGGANSYAAPPPPPLPPVVEFPTGRYELRGDGVYTPHSWVWNPNPPVAPPPPAAPPAPPAEGGEPMASRPAPTTTGLYRWTNEQGVTTWTDNAEKIPVRYRGQASRLTP
jgi:hypothetical protein